MFQTMEHAFRVEISTDEISVFSNYFFIDGSVTKGIIFVAIYHMQDFSFFLTILLYIGAPLSCCLIGSFGVFIIWQRYCIITIIYFVE